ncbi:MAG: hypothetical protein IPO37_22160 [Saprospiraceae bacterium]|nr:hypothetical protein [Saprospiraceae bacterium]
MIKFAVKKSVMMKNLLFIIFLVTLVSCETGNSELIFTKIEGQVQDDGTMDLFASFNKEGINELENAQEFGFAADTVLNPEVLTANAANSARGILNGNSFTGKYEGAFSFRPYYFRAYVVKNDGSTVYSDNLMVDSVNAKRIQVPCNLDNNTFVIGGTKKNIFNSAELLTENRYNRFYAYNPEYYIDVEFDFEPRTGIYTTTRNSPDDNQVRITMYGSIKGIIKEGDTIIVNQIGKNKWQMSFCNAKFGFGSAGSTTDIIGNLTFPFD